MIMVGKKVVDDRTEEAETMMAVAQSKQIQNINRELEDEQCCSKKLRMEQQVLKQMYEKRLDREWCEYDAIIKHIGDGQKKQQEGIVIKLEDKDTLSWVVS